MFGNVRIKNSKATPKRQSSGGRFSFIRNFTDRCYRNPYTWGLMKCIAFFAISVYGARVLCELDILPAEAPDKATQAAF